MSYAEVAFAAAMEHETVNVFGAIYPAIAVLRLVDEPAYREAFNDWLDSESGKIADALAHWLEQNIDDPRYDMDSEDLADSMIQQGYIELEECYGPEGYTFDHIDLDEVSRRFPDHFTYDRRI